jgi:hypothetical protein
MAGRSVAICNPAVQDATGTDAAYEGYAKIWHCDWPNFLGIISNETAFERHMKRSRGQQFGWKYAARLSRFRLLINVVELRESHFWRSEQEVETGTIIAIKYDQFGQYLWSGYLWCVVLLWQIIPKFQTLLA